MSQGIKQLSPSADAIVDPQRLSQPDAIGSPRTAAFLPAGRPPRLGPSSFPHLHSSSAGTEGGSWNPLLPSHNIDLDPWFGVDISGTSPVNNLDSPNPIFGLSGTWGSPHSLPSLGNQPTNSPSWSPRSLPSTYTDYLQFQGQEDRQGIVDRQRRGAPKDPSAPRPTYTEPSPSPVREDREARADQEKRRVVGRSNQNRQSPSALSYRPKLSPSPHHRASPSPDNRNKTKKGGHSRGPSWNHRKSDSETWRFDLDISKVVSGEDLRTALMVKNVPNKYNQEMLLEAVNEQHKGLYDFFYLPIDFKNTCNVGYAFINFIDPQSIPSFYATFNQKKWLKFNSSKVCQIAYARIQGKAAFIEHFRNSSLMHEDPKCRPVIFYSSGEKRGLPEPFPIPSPSPKKNNNREEGIFAFDEDSDVYNESDFDPSVEKDFQ